MENSELLERLLPGYRIVCRMFARYLGIDLTKTMTILFVVWALFKSIEHVWASTSRLFTASLTSSISIPSKESIHDEVLQWVSANVIDNNLATWAGVRSLSVCSGRDSDVDSSVEGAGKAGKSTSPLRYEPAFGSTIWFFKDWRVITLQRRKGQDNSSSGETIILSCIGLTAKPLKAFLGDCREYASGARSILRSKDEPKI